MRTVVVLALAVTISMMHAAMGFEAYAEQDPTPLQLGVGIGPDEANQDDRPFVTTWRITGPGESITIPVGDATGTYTIDWGDGIVSADVSGDQTHTYDTAGDYTIRIYGDFTRITLDEDPSIAQKLLSIDQWGDIQ